MARMVVGLAGGSVEKLLVASTVIGGAVALDLDVDVYLLLGGAHALRKGAKIPCDHPELEHTMLDGMHRHKIPDALSQLRRLHESGKVRIHVCSTAGKIWGAERVEDFVLCDDIVRIAEYLSSVQGADVVQVL